MLGLSYEKAGLIPPGYGLGGVGLYHVGHNLLKSHAAAWRLYNTTYRHKQKGKVTSVTFKIAPGNALVRTLGYLRCSLSLSPKTIKQTKTRRSKKKSPEEMMLEIQTSHADTGIALKKKGKKGRGEAGYARDGENKSKERRHYNAARRKGQVELETKLSGDATSATTTKDHCNRKKN